MGTLRAFVRGERTGDARFNFYRPIANSQGVIVKVIRFIPSVSSISEEFEDDFVDKKHWAPFGMGFGISCPRTIDPGAKCVVCEHAYMNRSNPEVAKLYRAQQNIVMNILVLEDNETVSNVGKVFKYQVPWDVVKKIKDMAVGTITGQECIVYDIETGCDFRLIANEKEQGKGKYSSSQFLSPSPVPMQYRQVIAGATLDDLADAARFATMEDQMRFLNSIESVATTGVVPSSTMLNIAQPTLQSAPTAATPADQGSGGYQPSGIPQSRGFSSPVVLPAHQTGGSQTPPTSGSRASMDALRSHLMK